MAKFARIEPEEEGEESYLFFCPGCQCAHWVRVRGKNPCWTWNGDVNRPTVTPSLNVHPNTEQQCHSFITDGKMIYLADCWHDLKGKTVEIPDFEDC